MAAPKYSGSELLTGLFVSLCAALFVVMMLYFGKLSQVWGSRQELAVVFDNIGGLAPDAPVRYDGIEIGRVKSIGVLHLDEKSLERFRPFTKDALDDLPLPEAVQRALREVKPEDLDAKVRKELYNRTMIELGLEVLLEEDYKRYRVDDKVQVTSTILGDTAVDITSGNGDVNSPANPKLLLGVSGDFFSNLANSMGDVKEILSNVSAVVGPEERAVTERARARFNAIEKNMDQLKTFAAAHGEATAAKGEAAAKAGNALLTRARKMLDDLQPSAKKAAERARTSVDDVRARLGSLRDEVAQARAEIAEEAKPLQQDLNDMVERSRPELQAMTASVRKAYQDFGKLSDRIGTGEETAAALASQSYADWQRFLGAASASIVNFTEAQYAARENIDLMISRRDRGEHDLNTAVSIYRHLNQAARHIETAEGDLQEAGQSVPQAAPDVRETSRRMEAVRDPVAAARDACAAALHPRFERKRAAWVK